MDAGFDQDEAEFGVFVFAVALEVFADGDGLVGRGGEVLVGLEGAEGDALGW